MSAFVNDVKFTSTTSGTADFTIGSAIAGFQLPSAAAGFSAVATYSYSARTTTQFESGTGVCDGTTQARTSVVDGSSGAGVKVNFSSAPTVILTFLKDDVPAPGGSNTQVQFNDSSSFGGDSALTWDKTNNVLTINGALITGDAANVLAQRNSTTAQVFRIYNTYTDSSNYERGIIDWTTTANTLTIGTQNAGTGTARGVTILSANGTVRINGTSNAPALGINGTASGIGDDGSATAIYYWIGAAVVQYIEANALNFHQSVAIKWSNAAAAGGPKDAGLARNTAGVVEVNSGTAGTFRDLLARSVIHNGTTIASLPTGVAGMVAYVTDGDASLAWGATVVNSGAGATKYLVWYNGSNWTVAGK